MSDRIPAAHAVDELVPLAHRPDKAAARLGIGKTMLYELIEAKEIHAFKVGVRTLIPESELQRFIAARLRAAANEPAH